MSEKERLRTARLLLLEADRDGSEELVGDKVDRDLVTDQFRIERKVSQDAVASNRIESTEQSKAICPARYRLCKARRDDRRSNDYEGYALAAIFESCLIFHEEEFLSHTFRVAVVVGEAADYGLLDLQDVLLVHAKDLLVVSLPVVIARVHFLIDESKFVRCGEQSGDLRKALKSLAPLCQFHQ